MTTYYYRAKDLMGNVYDGELEASSQGEAASVLQRKGLFIARISDRGSAQNIKKKGASSSSVMKKEFVLFGRITAEDKMVFCIQLANMVSAGLPLVQALHIILKQMKNPKFYSVLENVYQEVEGGKAFSDVLEEYPKVFPPYFTSSIKAGEISGKLGTVLESVAEFTEHDMEVRQNMQAALSYPIILMVVGTGIVFFIVTGVIPSFVSTFMRIGVELPVPTQILYNISIFLKTQWLFIVLGVGVAIVLFRTSGATATGKLLFDRIKLRIPFMGPMIEKFSLSRFGRTLGMLLNCGVPILQAIEIVEKNVGNEVFSRATKKVHESIRQGRKVADALKEAGDFPLDLIQMVAVGEETGKLDQLLDRLGIYYDTTAKYAVKKFMAMLEPVFLLVLGVFIAFIMASVLLPIFDMMKLLRQSPG